MSWCGFQVLLESRLRSSWNYWASSWSFFCWFTRKEMSKEKNPLPLFSKANITFGLLFWVLRQGEAVVWWWLSFGFFFCGVLCWLHITNVSCSLLVLWWFLGGFRVRECDGFGWRGSLVSSVSGGFGSRPWQGRLVVVVGCLFGGGGCRRCAVVVVILFWIGIRGVGLGLTFWAWPGPFTFELYFHI